MARHTRYAYTPAHAQGFGLWLLALASAFALFYLGDFFLP